MTSMIGVSWCKVVLELEKVPLHFTLCKLWKDAKLFKQFKLVQIVQLCNSSLANATNIKSLLFADNFASSFIESVASEIIATSGEGVLLVLDGYDELPLEKQTDSLYVKLIKGEYLPKCKIIITSRPSVAEKLERECIAAVFLSLSKF